MENPGESRVSKLLREIDWGEWAVRLAVTTHRANNSTGSMSISAMPGLFLVCVLAAYAC